MQYSQSDTDGSLGLLVLYTVGYTNGRSIPHLWHCFGGIVQTPKNLTTFGRHTLTEKAAKNTATTEFFVVKDLTLGLFLILARGQLPPNCLP